MYIRWSNLVIYGPKIEKLDSYNLEFILDVFLGQWLVQIIVYLTN